MRRYAISTLAAVGALLGFSDLSLGQSLPSTSQTADLSSGTLEEIQVFAQKRTESVQSVPIAVTTVSATDIANWRLDDSTDLQNVTPNLTIGSVYQGTTPQITLRGVGVNDGIETTSPSVGTYIDQLYMGNASAAVMQVFDMGRVEILRGPQGTLYGKNTNGGAINLYTQRPTDDFRAEVDLEAGNYSERSGSAFVSGPIFGENLTGRLSVYYKDRDGYGEVLAPGPVDYSANQVWAEHSYGIRAQLLYRPTDNMEWLILASNGRNRVTYGWPVIGLRDPANPSVDCANPLSGTCSDAGGERLYSPARPYSTIQDKLSSTTPETTVATVQGTWTLNSIALTSISGYIHTHTRLIDDGASDYGGPGNDLFYFDQNKHSDQLSQEFRVASVHAQTFNWTTGLYYSTNTLSLPVTYEFSGAPGTTDGRRTTTSYAAFGQADYAITSKWKVTAGARYSYTGLASNSTNLGGNVTEASHHWGSVGGRLALDYQLTDSTLSYVSYNRGFKEGNLNVGIYGTGHPKASVIKPELIDAFEVGIKSDITRQFRLNGDFFYNKLKDMQVAGADPTNFNFPTITNAARATTYGVELEATAKPIPNLLVSANYGYLHARFENYYVLSVLTGAPDFPTVLVNASGHPIPLSPTNTFSGQAEYSFALGNLGTIAPRINYSYRSAQAFTPEGLGNPRAAQDGYGLLGAGLKYDSPDHLEIDVWGRNLTNKAYLVDVQPADSFNGSDFPTFGMPRMYGVTLRKKF